MQLFAALLSAEWVIISSFRVERSGSGFTRAMVNKPVIARIASLVVTFLFFLRALQFHSLAVTSRVIAQLWLHLVRYDKPRSCNREIVIFFVSDNLFSVIPRGKLVLLRLSSFLSSALIVDGNKSVFSRLFHLFKCV